MRKMESSRGFYLAITMTSWWARWRLRSPALRLLIQPFIQAQIKENTKAPRHWLCEGNSPGTGEFPAQMASNAESASIEWRHHSSSLRSPILEFWRHQVLSRNDMENNFRVTGPLWGKTIGHRCVSHHKGPVTQSFDSFFDAWLSKRLNGVVDSLRRHHAVHVMSL